MDAAQSLHPTDQTLNSYGLGKLDDPLAEAVNEHLMECSDCRKRVAEMSADSFLGRVRDAQKPSEWSNSGPLQAGGTQGGKGANTLTSSSADSLPPGLADHPDYEIKRELGRGGMGVVYLAHNTMMGRDEVLKVMGQHLMDRPGVLDRFLREIRAVARLRHPNIVTAHHATRFGQSVIFAMEHVEGLDLSKLVKAKGPMPVAHACLFIHQAALGLQHAHEEGLVHRDIKPHNLMLSRKGDKATVKILDFGLAKAAREEKVEGGLTATGQALGTPDYIAPEQILDAQSADIRADIYSLGGTLYYLLTGRPPFQAKSLYDLYQAHISRDADPLNLVRPDVPAELAALVAKMMAKDPAERFQTPGEVAQALKPFCTKANAALKIVKADVSQADPAKAGRTVAEAASAAIQVETNADRRNMRPRTSSESSASESRWESMIDFRESEDSLEAAPDIAPSRRSPWVWSSVAVGVLMLGLFAAWMGGVFKVKTPDGVIVLENVPRGSEILVDGITIIFTWPGVGKPLEIRAVPGQHRLEVKKDGFKTFVDKEAAFKTDESEEITVRLEPLEPLVVNRPELKPVLVQPEPKKEEISEGKTDKGPEPKTEVFVPRPVVEKPPVTTAREPSVLLASDSLQPGSVWLSEPGNNTFTILERQGERFKSRFVINNNQIREVNGTIKDGRLRWHAREVKAIAGNPGGDNEGEVKGDEVAMTWSDPGGPIRGRFTLRLVKRASAGFQSEKIPVTVDSIRTAKIGPKGHWQIEGDELVQTTLETNGVILFGDQTWTDYAFSADVKLVQSKSHAALFFRSGGSQAKGSYFYTAGIAGAERGSIASFIDGQFNVLADRRSRDAVLIPGRWHTMKIDVKGDNFIAYLDGHLVFMATDAAKGSGCVGFRTWESACRFRNVKVTAPDGTILWKGLPEMPNE